MTLIWHNDNEGGKTIPLQAVRIIPKTKESYECFSKGKRPKVHPYNFCSCFGVDVPLYYVNTKNKLLDFVYNTWGAGHYIIMGGYVNNYSRKRFKRCKRKMLCKVWIREFVDENDNLSDKVEKRMYADEYLRRLKWFRV